MFKCNVVLSDLSMYKYISNCNLSMNSHNLGAKLYVDAEYNGVVGHDELGKVLKCANWSWLICLTIY